MVCALSAKRSMRQVSRGILRFAVTPAILLAVHCSISQASQYGVAKRIGAVDMAYG
jgi:hypothetical protein